MISRKCKSIGARPTTQYDPRRFHSLDAWSRYTDNIFGSSILPERKVEIYHTEFDDFKTELERCNLHKCLTNLADGTILCIPNPQGHWIEDSKKIGLEMQETTLRFSRDLG